MSVNLFLSGGGTACFLMSALFFLKFWRASRDRFFSRLSMACVLFALERIIGLITYQTMPHDPASVESTLPWIYLVRLVGFLIILYAVIQKNRSEKV